MRCGTNLEYAQSSNCGMLGEEVESLRRQILAELRRSYLNCELARDVLKETSEQVNRSDD